jgi:hypothetical protein
MVNAVGRNKKVKDLPLMNNLKKILPKSSLNLLYYSIIKICL